MKVLVRQQCSSIKRTCTLEMTGLCYWNTGCPERDMGIYEKYFLPKLLNLAMKAPALNKVRRQLVPMAKGRVLPWL